MITKIIIATIIGGLSFASTMINEIPKQLEDPAKKAEYEEYQELEQQIIEKAKEEEARQESIAKAEEELTTIQKLYIEVEGKAPVECKAILIEHGIQFEEAECPKDNAECEVLPCCNVDICLRVKDGDEELQIGYGKIAYSRGCTYIWTEYDMSRVGYPGNPGWERYKGNSHKDQMIYLNRME